MCCKRSSSIVALVCLIEGKIIIVPFIQLEESARTSLARAGNRTRIRVDKRKFFPAAGPFLDSVVVSTFG